MVPRVCCEKPVSLEDVGHLPGLRPSSLACRLLLNQLELGSVSSHYLALLITQACAQYISRAKAVPSTEQSGNHASASSCLLELELSREVWGREDTAIVRNSGSGSRNWQKTEA